MIGNEIPTDGLRFPLAMAQLPAAGYQCRLVGVNCRSTGYEPGLTAIEIAVMEGLWPGEHERGIRVDFPDPRLKNEQPITNL